MTAQNFISPTATARPAPVRAGDLITSDLMNGIIDWLGDLERRLATLQTSEPKPKVTITSVTGATTPLRVGTRITVRGTNFAQPAMLNTVKVAGIKIPDNGFTITSSDEQLSFDIPDVPDLPPSGTSVPITISNVNGSSNLFLFTLLPLEVVAQGRIEVTYSTPPTIAITAGQGSVFLYTLRTFVNQDATVTVTPTLDAPSGWTAELLQDAAEQARTSPTLSIPAGNGAEHTLRIRVNVPAGAATGTAGTLIVNANGPRASQILPGASSPIAIVVGSPAPTPETRVRLSFAGAQGAILTNGRVVFSRGAPAGVNFNVAVTEPRTSTPPAYQIKAMPRSADWTVEPSDGGFNVPIASSTSPADITIPAVVTPPNQASNTDIILTVTSSPDISVSFVLPVSTN